MNEIVQQRVCVRGHDARTGALDDGSATPALAEHGMLCEDCYRRLEWVLDDLPDVVLRARQGVVPSIVRPPSMRVSGSKEPPLPFDARAVADADDLFAALANWTAAIARSLELRGPGELADVIAADVNVTGLSADSSPAAAADTTEGIVRWLLEHLERISESRLVADLFDEIVPAIEKARRRWGTNEPKLRRTSRVCPCGHDMVRVAWSDQRPTVWCARCLLPQPIDWTVLT